MQTPSLRQLEMFKLLMKTQSLTDTARHLNVSQPAVSQALREVEVQLGLELFLRVGGRIRPTAEAQRLLPDVERLFSNLGSLVSNAVELRDKKAGRLVIAATPIISSVVLSEATALLMNDRSRAQINIVSTTTMEVVEMVKQETADLGFTFQPVREQAVSVEPLVSMQMTCLMRDDHPLAQRTELTIEDLIGERVIALSVQNPSGSELRKALAARGIENFSQVETNSAIVCLKLVKHGVGIAVVDPVAVLGGDASGIVLKRLVPSIDLSIAVISSRHRERPGIAQEFVDHARAVTAAQVAVMRSFGAVCNVVDRA